MRYFLKFSYNGSPFHGWQRQPNAASVQQMLEETLAVVMRQDCPVTGAGRTDTGVHARVMYAHFDCDRQIDVSRMVRALNSMLGPSIAVSDIIRVADDAHARFDAVSRTYKYFITSVKSPFLCNLAWHCPSQLDMDRMNEAAGRLLSVSDFTSFAKLHSDALTNICDVREAFWRPLDAEGECPSVGVPGLVFTITADRFLRNMVRAVVGTLLDVGRGKLSVDGFSEIVESLDRCAAGQSVPPQGLFLWDVRYPYL